MLEGEVYAHEKLAEAVRSRLRAVARSVQNRLQRSEARVTHYRTTAAEAADVATVLEARIAGLRVRSPMLSCFVPIYWLGHPIIGAFRFVKQCCLV